MPAVPLERSTSSGTAHCLSSRGILEQCAERFGQLANITGSHEVCAETVLTDDLRDGASSTDHQGRTAGHCLDGRQRKAFVERRNTRDLGGTDQLSQLNIADAVDETDGVGDGQVLN